MNSSQLTIHISRTSVHVAEVLLSSQEIIKEETFQLMESSSEGYKKALSEVFNQFTFKDSYQEYTAAWSTPKNIFVPLGVFNESSEKSIYKLMFGKDIDESTIDYNRLMELSMVSVYEIPHWVKSFLIMKYPTIAIKHEHAMVIRALFQKNTFKRKINLTFNDEYINIDIIDKNELTFSNTFEYQTVEDVVYHLLFVLRQENLMEQEGGIDLYYVGEPLKTKAEETIKILEQIKPFQRLSIGNIDSVIKLHTLCV